MYIYAVYKSKVCGYKEGYLWPQATGHVNKKQQAPMVYNKFEECTESKSM